MLDTLSAFFYRISSWKTLLLAIALYIPFPAYILKKLEAQMNTLAGKPVGPIDLLVGYDPDRIIRMVEEYGSDGRSVYAWGELTDDIAYPIIYTSLLCIILSLLFRNRTYAPFRLVNVVPIGIWLVDLLENVCIVYLLKSYPQSSITIAAVCSVLTNLKWVIFTIALGLVLYGLVRLIIGRRRTQLS